MSEWITVERLKRWYEGRIPDTPGVNARLELLVALATARLAARVPSIQRRIDSGELEPILVEGALAEIVLRPVRNPRGVVQEQAGEFSYRLESAAARAGALVTVTDDDIRDLLPATPGIGVIGSARIALAEWGRP